VRRIIKLAGKQSHATLDTSIIYFPLILVLASCQLPESKAASESRRQPVPLSCGTPAQQILYPIQLDSTGHLVHPDQLDQLTVRLKTSASPNIFVFVHGWDKTFQLAQQDYEDFACRLYKQTPDHDTVLNKELDLHNSILIGIHWPATLFAEWQDPLLLKPATFCNP